MTVFVTLPHSLSVMQSGSYNTDTNHSSVTDGRAQDRVKTQLNITAYKRKTKLLCYGAMFKKGTGGWQITIYHKD